MSKRNIYYEDDNGDLESTGATGSSLVYTGPPKKIKTISAGTGITVTDNTTYLTITNSSTGDAVTLTSAGGTETLVNDGTGPALATKGITAGGGISLSSTATALTITNSSRASDATLTSAGGDYTLVNDGAGPDFAIKGITVSGGVTASADAVKVTLSSAAPTSIGANDTATANSLTLSSNVLKAAAASATTRGVVHGMTASGNTNAYFGYNAGGGISSGTGNTFFGDGAGLTCTTGTGNTIFGKSSDVSSTSGTDRVVLGRDYSASVNGTCYFPSSTISFRLQQVNTLVIGTALGTSASAANLFYDNATGFIYRSTSTSSEKKNIRPIEHDTNSIFLLQPRQYESDCRGEGYLGPGEMVGCDYCDIIRDPENKSVLKDKLDQTHLANRTCPFHIATPQKTKIGFIAEDFAAIGLDHACERDKDGKIIDYDLKCVVACLFNELKKIREELNVLKTQ